MTPDLDQLWGATIRAVDVDVAGHRVTIDVELDAPVTTLGTEGHPDRRIVFDRVSEFHWEASTSERWDYVELTEVHISRTPDGRSTVELLLWAEPDAIRVVCDHVEVVAI